MSALKYNSENPPRITRRLKYGADKFILVKDRRIHYLEAGTGVPVLLLPGPTSMKRIWNRLAPLLSHNYHVLVLENYGVGYNRPAKRKTERATEEQTETLARMVRQLGLVKVNLVSSDGSFLLDFAARYPEVTDKTIILGGHISASEAGTGRLDKKAERIPIRLQQLRSAKPLLMYVYGGKPGTENPTVRQDLGLIHTYWPDTWVAALETGLFESVIRDPQEVADLISEFLGGSPSFDRR